jgi:hypothetical protein
MHLSHACNPGSACTVLVAGAGVVQDTGRRHRQQQQQQQQRQQQQQQQGTSQGAQQAAPCVRVGTIPAGIPEPPSGAIQVGHLCLRGGGGVGCCCTQGCTQGCGGKSGFDAALPELPSGAIQVGQLCLRAWLFFTFYCTHCSWTRTQISTLSTHPIVPTAADLPCLEWPPA